MAGMIGRSLDPLTPVLISQITGKKYPDTKNGRQQMDRDDGRVHIPNSCMEAIITLQASSIVAGNAQKVIEPFIKKTGAGRMLKAQIAGMRKSLHDIMCVVSSSQNRTLQSNSMKMNITVSSGKVPAMINIDVDDMAHICNRALEMCAFSCDCTREESKECRLRHAFEQVASSCVEAEREDPTKCPYAGMTLDDAAGIQDEGGDGDGQGVQGQGQAL